MCERKKFSKVSSVVIVHSTFRCIFRSKRTYENSRKLLIGAMVLRVWMSVDGGEKHKGKLRVWMSVDGGEKHKGKLRVWMSVDGGENLSQR